MDEYLKIKEKIDELIATDKVDDASAVEVLNELSSNWEKLYSFPSVVDCIGTLLLDLLRFVFSNNKKVREISISILGKLQICLSANLSLKQEQWWKSFRLYIEQCSVDKMINLMSVGPDDWPIIWCILARIIGEEMNASLSTANALLRVLEKAFKSKSADQDKERQAAFECWKTLIDGFALSKDTLSLRRIDILLIPLKAPNHSAKTVCEAKLQTWMYLITVMGLKKKIWLDLFVPSLIEFLYVGNRLLPPACQIIPSNRCASEFITLVKNSFIFKHHTELLVRSSLKCIESVKDDSSLLHVVWCSILDGLRKSFDGNTGDNDVLNNAMNELVNVIKQLSLIFSKNEFPKFLFSCTQGKNKLIQLKNYYESLIDIVLNYDLMAKLDVELFSVVRSIMDLYQPKERSEAIFCYVIDKCEILMNSMKPPKQDDINMLGEIWRAVSECLVESAPWIFANDEFTVLYETLLFPLKFLLTSNGEDNGKLLVHWKDLLGGCLKAIEVNKQAVIANELVARLAKEKLYVHSSGLDAINIIVELTESCNVLPYYAEITKDVLSPSSELVNVNFISAVSESILKYAKKNSSSVSELLDIVNKLENIKGDKASINKIVTKMKNTLSSMSNITPKKNSRFLHRLARAKEIEYKRQNASPGTSPQSMFDLKNNIEKKLLSPCIKTPSKKSVDEDSQEYVMVPPKPRTTPLTEHQKENLSKRKSDIPALYQDLSQDTQSLDRIELKVTESKHLKSYPVKKSVSDSTNKAIKNEVSAELLNQNLSINNIQFHVKETKKLKNDEISEKNSAMHCNIIESDNSLCRKESSSKVPEEFSEEGKNLTSKGSMSENSIKPSEQQSEFTNDKQQIKKKRVARKSLLAENNEVVRKSTRKRTTKISPQKLLDKKRRKSLNKGNTPSANPNNHLSNSLVGKNVEVFENCVDTAKRPVNIPPDIVDDAVFPEIISKLDEGTTLNVYEENFNVNVVESNLQRKEDTVCIKNLPEYNKNTQPSRSNFSETLEKSSVNEKHKIEEKNNECHSESQNIKLNEVNSVNHPEMIDTGLEKGKLESDQECKVSVLPQIVKSTPIRRLRSNHRTHLPKSPCVCCDSSHKKKSMSDVKKIPTKTTEFKGASRSLFSPNDSQVGLEKVDIKAESSLNVKDSDKNISVITCGDKTVESVKLIEVVLLEDLTVIRNETDTIFRSSDLCKGSNTAPIGLKKNNEIKNGRTPNRKRKLIEEQQNEELVVGKESIGLVCENKGIKVYVTENDANNISDNAKNVLDMVKKEATETELDLKNNTNVSSEVKVEDDDQLLMNGDECTQEELNDSIDSILSNPSPSPKVVEKSLRSCPLSKLLSESPKMTTDVIENKQKPLCVVIAKNLLVNETSALTKTIGNLTPSKEEIVRSTSDVISNKAGGVTDNFSQVNVIKTASDASYNKIRVETPLKLRKAKRSFPDKINEHKSAKTKKLDLHGERSCNDVSDLNESVLKFGQCFEEATSVNIEADQVTVSETPSGKNCQTLFKKKKILAPLVTPVVVKELLNEVESTPKKENQILNCEPEMLKISTNCKKIVEKKCCSPLKTNVNPKHSLKVDVNIEQNTSNEVLTNFTNSEKHETVTKKDFSNLKMSPHKNCLDNWVIRKQSKKREVVIKSKIDEHGIDSVKQIEENNDATSVTNDDSKCVFVAPDSEDIVYSSQEPNHSVFSVTDCVGKHEIIVETTFDESENSMSCDVKCGNVLISEDSKVTLTCEFKNDDVDISANVKNKSTDKTDVVDQLEGKLESEKAKIISSDSSTLKESNYAEKEISESVMVHESVVNNMTDKVVHNLNVNENNFQISEDVDSMEICEKNDVTNENVNLAEGRSTNLEKVMLPALNEKCTFTNKDVNTELSGAVSSEKDDKKGLNMVCCDAEIKNPSIDQNKKLHVCRRLVDDMAMAENEVEGEFENGKCASEPQVKILSDVELQNGMQCDDINPPLVCVEDSIIENKENVINVNEKMGSSISQTLDTESKKEEITPEVDVKIQEKQANKDKKSPFKRPDILCNKQKNLENKLSLSPTGQNSKCKQQLFNNSSPEKSSIFIENQNSSPQSARGRTAHLMELVCGSDTVSRPPRPTTPRRLHPIKIGNCISVTPCEQPSGETWICKTYSPHAIPSPGILKAKSIADDTSPPPSKKKRVNFHDPPVSRSLLFVPKQFGQGTVVECVKKSGNSDVNEEFETPSQYSRQPTEKVLRETDCSKKIWPSLSDCCDPIKAVASKFPDNEWTEDLEKTLLSIDVTDIGKLSTLSENVVERTLPIKPPKVERLRDALKAYEISLNESKGYSENENTPYNEDLENSKHVNVNKEVSSLQVQENILNNSRFSSDVNYTGSVKSEIVSDVTCKSFQELLYDKSPKDICDLLNDKKKLELLKYQLRQNIADSSLDSEILSLFSDSGLRNGLLQEFLNKTDESTKCKLITTIIKENNSLLKNIVRFVDKEVKAETYSADIVQDPQLLSSVLKNPVVFQDVLQNDEFIKDFYKNINSKTKLSLTCNDLFDNARMLNDILQLSDFQTVAESVSSALNDSSQFAEKLVEKLDLKVCTLLMKLLSEKIHNSVTHNAV